jgi:hypothetical protein
LEPEWQALELLAQLPDDVGIKVVPAHPEIGVQTQAAVGFPQATGQGTCSQESSLDWLARKTPPVGSVWMVAAVGRLRLPF